MKELNAIEVMIVGAIAVIFLAFIFGPPMKEIGLARYERTYPCINGVRYIRPENGQGLTPMIDPQTMQPQLCGPEADRP